MQRTQYLRTRTGKVPCLRPWLTWRTSSVFKVLFGWLLSVLMGCTTPGPIGSAGFDPHFVGVVDADERVLLYAPCEVRVGTYMENEIRMVPTYGGVLLLTDQGLRFLQWDAKGRVYQAGVQFPYGALAQHKLQVNTLIPSYVAVRTEDGHAYAFMLEDEAATAAAAILSSPAR